MKSQLDALMKERGIDAFIVTGSGDHNPAMMYLSGGGHFTADVIKKVGEDPSIYCFPMEREEAARTGLKPVLHNIIKSGMNSLAEEYVRMLHDLGVNSGKISLNGRVEASQFIALLQELKAIAPEYDVVGEKGTPFMMEARATKEEYEIERIRQMGKLTTKVVGRVADLLSSRPVRNSHLIDSDGEPLRISQVKKLINLWLAEEGAENPEGTIFSIGRDAGVPHSSGNPDDILELGKTIIFDIFPCEALGGYFYDFTRTWCLGYADDTVQKLYTDVKNTYDTVVDELKCGGSCKGYQNLTCDLFEAKGHPTIRTNPKTMEGYVHSLGHGLGLDVHEAPWFSVVSPVDNNLEPGAVFTVEPGLYYPDRGMGVRLEDTYCVTPTGKIEILADYPMDLVLPVKK